MRMLLDALRLALVAIARNRLRTMLTVLGILIGITAGTVFGFVPALRAARLDPIAALHTE